MFDKWVHLVQWSLGNWPWGHLPKTMSQSSFTGRACFIRSSQPSVLLHLRQWRQTAPVTPSWPACTPPLTFVLCLLAGNNPFHQAALHQSFSGESRPLPLPRVLQSAWCWLHAVGIPQQAAVDHLTVGLEGGGRRIIMNVGGLSPQAEWVTQQENSQLKICLMPSILKY